VSSILRLCLDLNIWCGDLIAEQHGRKDTATRKLVEMVRAGQGSLGPVQLIISWGMINRLRKVYVQDLNIPAAVADTLVGAMAGYAAVGPAGTPPTLTLGGTGVIPLADTEDAHVLETCIAAKAHILVTANFADFLTSSTIGTTVLEAGRIAFYTDPRGSLLIAHPYVMAGWLRQGQILLPDGKQWEVNSPWPGNE
jgi:PIN domain